MEDRQVLLALIKQNSEKINGIVASNSEANRVKDNERLVNTAINFCFCADSNCDYVKDFKYKIDELGLLRLYVLQNDIMSKIFGIKKIDFKYFLRDCKSMVDDFRYNERYKDYFSGEFEYKHLVPTRKEFMFGVHAKEPIKSLKKSEYNKISDSEKIQTLKNITNRAYNVYVRNVNSIDVKFVSYEKFEKNLNFGDMNELIKESNNKEVSDYPKENAIRREYEEIEIQDITYETKENLTKQDNGYYYDDGGQGYLFE